MILSLHTIQSAVHSRRRRKVVGRGNASGHGSYSTRGIKGQKARTGGRHGLKLLALKPLIQQMSKRRGFHSFYPKMVTVNLIDLEKHFSSGDDITVKSLLKKGVIDTMKPCVKILGSGKLTKKFVVKAHAFSVSAIKAIESAGGKAEKI